jgi:hypothetical protein
MSNAALHFCMKSSSSTASSLSVLQPRKLSHHEFASEFSEFFGDKEYVRDAIRGQAPMFVTEIA